MIKAVVIFNNHGKPRVTKFYEHYTENDQQQFINQLFGLISKRSDSVCNFLDVDTILGSDCRLVYRHYATLYFVFCVDNSESELGILDLIQVFVEVMDKCFENVCELDLIFNSEKVHYILDEIIMGGMVIETNLPEIHTAVTEQIKLERAASTRPPIAQRKINA